MNDLCVAIVMFSFSFLSLSTGNLIAQPNIDQNFTLTEGSSEKLIIQYNYPNSSNENFVIGVHSCCIVIPNGAIASYEINEIQTEHFVEDEFFLKSSENFPPILYKQAVSLSEPKKIRGLTYLVLSVFPFKYNSVNKEMSLYTDIEIQIDLGSGNKQYGEYRLRNRFWDYLFRNLFINYSSLPNIDYNKSISSVSDEVGAEYLIICPNDPAYQQWADSIKNFRTTQGILTTVVTLEDIGNNSASNIEDYINDAYAAWDIPPVAILCLGDEGTNPNFHIAAPVWDNYCASDNIYADVDNDNLPDIIVARICAENATQLETMVTKFINYEKYPSTNTGFYNNPITSCNFHQGGYFQLLTESIAGFYENVLGKSTNRINVGPTPLPEEWSTASYAFFIVEFFGPPGLGYIPSTPGEVNCSWNSTTADIVNGINSGANILLYRGQASNQVWLSPFFSNSDIDYLTNSDLTFVWSPNDLTGKFDAPTECLAEKFHRSNHGALGVVAASEITYSFLNEIYTWGAFDLLFPEFLPSQEPTIEVEGAYPAFANAAGKYAVEYTQWPVSPNQKELTFHVFHYFGDAFSNIITEMPQELDITHAPTLQTGDTSFEVMANEGALIGLSVNNELIGVAMGTGEPTEIQISPPLLEGQMLVTVTKQNYYRYENSVSIINPTDISRINSGIEFKIYPNPSQGKFSVECNLNHNILDITVLNTSSKVVFRTTVMMLNKDHIFIDLENQPKGLYYIIISSVSGKTIKKVVVQ